MAHAIEIARSTELPYLYDEEAVAACVLWTSNYFDTGDIALVLKVSEAAVANTIKFARERDRSAPNIQ